MLSKVFTRGVRLPCTSPRNSRDKFAKLLFYVDPEAQHGFGFEGKIVKPGQVLTDAELRPTDEYPARPVLLEYAQGPAHGMPGHRRRDAVYILWSYEGSVWRELGRAVSEAWDWALELRPLAIRALRDARGGALMRVVPDLHAMAARIASALDQELRKVERPDRYKVLAVLHDQLASRLCEA